MMDTSPINQNEEINENTNGAKDIQNINLNSPKQISIQSTESEKTNSSKDNENIIAEENNSDDTNKESNNTIEEGNKVDLIEIKNEEIVNDVTNNSNTKENGIKEKTKQENADCTIEIKTEVKNEEDNLNKVKDEKINNEKKLSEDNNLNNAENVKDKKTNEKKGNINELDEELEESSDEENANKLSNSYYNLINENKKELPKGIKNIGLSCYMNALLQCLFYIPKLRNYFISQYVNKNFNKKEQPICYYFSKIMYKLLQSKKPYITTYKFNKFLSETNPLFIKDKPADAADLLRILIDSILNEIPSNSEDKSLSFEDKYNKKEISKEIQKERNNNIIYELMNVNNITTNFCPKSKKITFSRSSESNIIFNLKNIPRNKETNEITLQNCFRHLIKQNKNNEFYCKWCKGRCKGTSQEKIFLPPEIMVIILNRGKNKSFNVKVKFDLILDISDYIDEDIDGDISDYSYYRLIGCCSHYGKSSPTGHYTATCFHDEKDSFYFFNDERVKPIKYFDYLGEPYILIYQRINIKENITPKEIIQTEINGDENRVIPNNELENYKRILDKVFICLKIYDKGKYKIEKVENGKNNMTKWIIELKDKKPLIMDFSDPFIYNLSSITYYQRNKPNNFDNINIKINLKEDKVINLYEKISIFLDKASSQYNIGDKKCNCNII